ncbi:hypothetical protein [Aliarcobacter cibarius]|uniref:DUF2846 domain-containing protein n=1 Tax=Aliarcobacter cibarius TaxID=255507 RepID=A0ABY2V8R7_9BACT|nr:hypothetical protein [Aliarcobacter cibarius]TLS99914.1 hypothetical protein FE247_05125 [Aliarcobacter cibarius]TLT00323.1 hypothetical protein FE245_05555 [Aliarcobacter cibarius]
MKRLSIVFLLAFLFAGCSQKEPNKVKELPHYNKEKVNLYLLNNETVLSNQVEFIYRIKSDNFNKNINVCYAQYSYTELEEGNYNIEVVQRAKRSPFSDRTDHEFFNSYLKKGETYILKIDKNHDTKSLGKLIAHNWLLDNSLDPKITILEVKKDEALNIFEDMRKHTNLFGKRPYPIKAEDSKTDDACSVQAFKNTF